MPSFSGTFQISGGRGPQSGACALSFDDQTLQVVAGATPVVACDLGDIDAFAPGDCILDLALYGGQHLRLQQFAKAFDNLVHDLLEAHRNRLVKCLLLDDLEEVARFDAAVDYEAPGRKFSAPAQMRLYRSNLACLPLNATGFQWRLADIDSVQFDADSYATLVRSGEERLRVTKLAKRTEEFRQRLEQAMQAVGERTAQVLHDLFPFLAPDRFASLSTVMKEGHPVSFVELKAIDPQTVEAIAANTVDDALKPYFDWLAAPAGESGTFAGFKIIRPEAGDEDVGEETAGDGNTEPDSDATILYWFFFRLEPPAAREPVFAWEATSRSGRATYLFRESALGPPADAARHLARGLALVNYRREPIYLSDDSLQMQPKFRRYAIAARRLPDLAALRRAFAGRAIHGSPESWRQQLDQVLNKK